MNEAVTRMLSRYDIQTPYDSYSALREIIQEIALYGLWDGGFFSEGVFYGGTALRIFYGLDSFSEDMDFSLLTPDPDFNFEKYSGRLLGALKNLGFEVELSQRKHLSDGRIWSAFLKGNRLSHLLNIGIPKDLVGTRNPREQLTVKLEIDVDPAGNFETEFLAALNPISYNVRLYTLQCLFAGKMHALLFRKWRKRVKGRDWYDMVWYLKNNIPLYLPYLESKMRQTGDWELTRKIQKEDVMTLYKERAVKLDVEKAIEDVINFIKDPEEVEKTWSNSFFLSLARLFTFRE